MKMKLSVVIFTFFIFSLFLINSILGKDIVLNGKSVKLFFTPQTASVYKAELDNKKYNLNWKKMNFFSLIFPKEIGEIEYQLLSQKEDEVSFIGKNQKLEVIKTFKIEKDYLISFSYSFKNLSSEKISFSPIITIKMGNWKKGDPNISPVYLKDKKKYKMKEKSYTGGEIEGVGIDTRYVISIFKFLSQTEKATLIKQEDSKEESRIFKFEFPKITLDSNEKVTFKGTFFLAPKKDSILKEYGFKYLIGRGILSSIILSILKFFYGIFHNWGLSIIMLTILIRLILYPLNSKQNKSMAEMQKIQPLVEEIKKKYGNDKEKLNQEILKLYREHGVNPFAGCLPLLIQLPVLFALFNTLRTSIELKGEPFLWIKDLSSPEFLVVGSAHVPVLAILIAVSTYIQMKTQSGANPQQSSMTMIMPIMMFFLSQALPAGVLLYWFVSNLLSIVQTYLDLGILKSAQKAKKNEK